MIGLPGSGKSTLADFLLGDSDVTHSTRLGEWNSRLHRQSVPPHTNSHISQSVREGGFRLSSPEFYSEGDDVRGRLISTDRIRAQLFGDESTQGSWLKIWLEVRSQFQQAAAEPLDFTIYDATNAVRKQRRAAIALARKCGFTHITGLWVNPPLETCLERNRLRSRQVPEAVIQRMARRLYGAPPSTSEGLDEVVTIS